MKMNVIKSLVVLSLFSATLAAQANVLTYTGTLQDAQDWVRFDFNLDADDTVNITTYSYAGGTMTDNTIVTEGGFDPDIVLYNATTGAYINYDDDSRGVSSSYGLLYDSFLSQSLTAGNYSLFLGVYSTSYGQNINEPRSSSATTFGQIDDDYSNLDPLLGPIPLQNPIQLTGNYAIEFVAKNANLAGGKAVSLPNGVEVSAVPEPETYAMFLAGLGLLGFASRRKQA